MTINGNGAGATSEVTTTTQSTTTVEQHNDAQITNNVSTSTDTGNNTADANTGGATTIETGSASSDTTVNNQNINSNTATAPSGSATGVNAQISNNGADSTNVISGTSNTSTTVSQTNNATITNTVITHANTGNNTANNNTGNVFIKTGTIHASNTIENKNINVSVSSIHPGSCDNTCVQQTINLLIKGNGAGSKNILNVSFDNQMHDESYNLAAITNTSIMDLNTGGNQASFNLGDVTIVTGDITAVTTINNENINSNVVEVSCNCVPNTPPTTPPPTSNETPTPQNNCNCGGSVGGGGGSSTPGSVLGATTGAVLPNTGMGNMLLWITLASLIMFFAGWYLRFRSGCAPGAVTA